MGQIDYLKHSLVLKALSHPVRLKILDFLLDNKCCVTEVWKAVGISQSITSQHLTILKNAGIVYSQKNGSKAYYFVNNDLAKGIILILRKNK